MWEAVIGIDEFGSMYRPVKLMIIFFDSILYTKLEIIARGAGFESISIIDKIEKIIPTLNKLNIGCHFVLIKTEPGNAEVENIPLHPEMIKDRFMQAITKYETNEKI